LVCEWLSEAGQKALPSFSPATPNVLILSLLGGYLFVKPVVQPSGMNRKNAIMCLVAGGILFCVVVKEKFTYSIESGMRF